jgi:putative glutathione S-transferase
MGLLVEGQWRDQWYDTASSGGRFVRKDSTFREWVIAEEDLKERGGSRFIAEPGRYHLYVSLACPWAHRTLIMRNLKALQSAISVSVVHWRMLENGWTFEEAPGVVQDPQFGAQYLRQIYTAANPRYTGRVTVPVLWDKLHGTIVNNESSEIIRMFNSAFDRIGAAPGDYYPSAHRAEIDALNTRINDTLNNGVYKAGFATTQTAYEEVIGPMFETLEWLEERLRGQRFLIGHQLTEADIRLFTTLVRFDLVYFGHFKCNLKRVVDYPNLWAYTRDLYQTPGFAETVNRQHIQGHYYQSHRSINPTGIVPAGPAIDFATAHDREALPGSDTQWSRNPKVVRTTTPPPQ